jgi:hypothetical protein
VEQFPGVVEQHARLPSLTHQLRDDVAHVAASHHVVEVTDNVRVPQVAAACGDVQCHGEDGLQAVEAQIRLGQEHGLARPGDFLHLRLGAAEVRQTIDHFR